MATKADKVMELLSDLSESQGPMTASYVMFETSAASLDELRAAWDQAHAGVPIVNEDGSFFVECLGCGSQRP